MKANAQGRRGMSTIDEDNQAILDLIILLAQPDTETATGGMRRVVQVIVDRVQSIRHELKVGPRLR